jgi:hypothetical protein
MDDNASLADSWSVVSLDSQGHCRTRLISLVSMQVEGLDADDRSSQSGDSAIGEEL